MCGVWLFTPLPLNDKKTPQKNPKNIWPISTQTFFMYVRILACFIPVCPPNVKFIRILLIFRTPLYVWRTLCNVTTERSTHIKHGSQLPGTFQQPDWKYPVLLPWQVNQLYLQFLFSISLPKICAAARIIMRGPRAFVELNNRCTARCLQKLLLLCQHTRVNRSLIWLICNSDN